MEGQTQTTGLFVHFRKSIDCPEEPPKSLVLHVTADTRYKLFVNQKLASFGPVKGDHTIWVGRDSWMIGFVVLHHGRRLLNHL